jgi:hypothetical protein
MNLKAFLRTFVLAVAVTMMLGATPSKSRARELSISNTDASAGCGSGMAGEAVATGFGSSRGLITPASGAIFGFVPESGTCATMLSGLGMLVCLQRFRRSRRV